MDNNENTTWVLIYSDLITVLLCFFVIFYSQNNQTTGMWDKMKTGFNTPVTDEEQFKFSSIVGVLDNLLENPEYSSITYIIDRKGIEVNFAGNVLFESGNADLNKDGIKILNVLAKRLVNSISFDYEMEIQGHTDSMPIQNNFYPSNWELSTARASKVARFFISKGVNPNYIKVVGFAEFKRKRSDKETKGLSVTQLLDRDRRVVILLNPRRNETF